MERVVELGEGFDLVVWAVFACWTLLMSCIPIFGILNHPKYRAAEVKVLDAFLALVWILSGVLLAVHVVIAWLTGTAMPYAEPRTASVAELAIASIAGLTWVAVVFWWDRGARRIERLEESVHPRFLPVVRKCAWVLRIWWKLTWATLGVLWILIWLGRC
jgi:hypothetical protein